MAPKKKQPSMSTLLGDLDHPEEKPSTPKPPKPKKQAVKKPAEQPKYTPNPGRVGMRTVSGYFSEDAHRQFKMLGVEYGSNNQEMLREALNLLFEKYGKKPIA